MRRKVTSLVVFALLATTARAESCISDTGRTGECREPFTCPSGFNDLKLNKPDYGNCDEDTTDICCVEDNRSLKTHERKCLEYFMYTFQDQYVPSSNPSAPLQLTKSEVCIQPPDPFIKGGNDTKPKEYPLAASIGDDNDTPIFWFCGGSLISEQFVLTAAHCFKSRRRARIVRLGTRNLANPSPEKFDAKVAQVIQHPAYKTQLIYHDIALVKLASPLKLSPAIRPGCLPSEPLNPSLFKKLVAVGWGNTEYMGYRSDNLLKAAIAVHDHEDCKRGYGVNKYAEVRSGITDDIICLLDPSRKADTCQGDSGGPVLINSRSVYCSYVIYGITSAGVGCGDSSANLPTLYTNVYNYVDWISGIVWKNQ